MRHLDGRAVTGAFLLGLTLAGPALADPQPVAAAPAAADKEAQLAQIRAQLPAAVAHLKQTEARLEHSRQGLGEGAREAAHSWITAAVALDSVDIPSQSAVALHLLKWGDQELQTLWAVRHGHKDPNGLIKSERDLLPYEDLYNVDPGDHFVFSGSYPSATGDRWLKQHGFTAVVNFTADDSERARAKAAGLKYYQISFPDHQAPKPAQVDEFLQVLAKERASGGKVYTHCVRGIGRDHTMFACYEVVSKGISADKAIDEGLKAAPPWALDQTGGKVQFDFIRDYAKSEQASKEAQEFKKRN